MRPRSLVFAASFLVFLPAASAAQCKLATPVPSDIAPGDRPAETVAIDVGVAVLGKPNPLLPTGPTSDAAYVFEGSGQTWTETARLHPGDFALGANFGDAVDVQGDTILVSDPGGFGEIYFSGKVYVFERSGGGWAETGRFDAGDGEHSDQFGHAVALSSDGSCAVTGAPYKKGRGAAYVHRRFGSLWIQQARLMPSDAPIEGIYGWDVAIDGDVAVVGDWVHDGAGESAGAAYVFEYDGDDWVETAVLTGHDTDTFDGFGHAVDVDAATGRILVGAISAGSGGSAFVAGPGRAYLFEKGPGGWHEVAFFEATAGPMEGGFGYSVAVDGELALIGATPIGGRGEAFLFERQESGWVLLDELSPPNLGSGVAHFGESVALGGGHALVGAPEKKSFLTGLEGKSYLFDPDAPATIVGSPPSISLATGGAQDLALWSCPTGNPFLAYLVLGSLDVPGAGIPVDQWVIPLAMDDYFLFTLQNPDTPPLSSSLGFLDPSGAAAARITVPAGLPPTLAGVRLAHAFVVIEALPQTLLHLIAVSDTATLELVP